MPGIDWIVLSPAPPNRFDGVGDYAFRLAGALQPYGRVALVIGARDRGWEKSPPDGYDGLMVEAIGGWRNLWRTRGDLAGAHTWIVQYVPQLYLRGDAVWLCAWLLWLRLRGRRVVLTVHEWNVSWGLSWRRILARLAFDAMLAYLGVVASRIVTPQERYRREIAWRLFWRRRGRIRTIPVGTNIPVVGLADPPPNANKPILTIFGRSAGLDCRLLVALAAWLAGPGQGALLRWIGPSREEILAIWSARCGLPAERLEIRAGEPAAAVSRLLSESALLLVPVDDGVSTRRTTVVAALAHGLPIVGTDGASTDDDLRGSPAFELVPCGDAGAFVARVDALLADPARRARMSAAARALSDARFSWPAIGDAYVQVMTGRTRAIARERGRP